MDLGRFPAVCDCDHVGCCKPCPSCVSLRAEVDRLHQHDCASAIGEARCQITALKQVVAELESRNALLEKMAAGLNYIIDWAKLCGKYGHPGVDHLDWEDELERKRAALDAAKEGGG